MVTITEGKELLTWFKSVPYGVIYNICLDTLGIPPVWISKLDELKKIKNAVNLNTIY
jgi:hypothetical protein